MPTFTLQQRNADLDAHNAKILARIALETNTDPQPGRATLSLLGDERQLRGIPALARGVTGTITGTQPGSTL